MKRSVFKYLFVLISFGLYSSNLFAQTLVFRRTPADPGADPMKADSARYIIVLQPATNNQSTSPINILPEKKDRIFINKKSSSEYLGKKMKRAPR